MSNVQLNWETIVNDFVPHLDLEQQIRYAEMSKVEVPQDVLDELAAMKARASMTLTFGTQKDPDRCYLTFDQGSPIGGTSKSGTPRTGKIPYLEVRTLDAEIQRLTAARDAAREAGLPTNPEAGSPTVEAAKAAGFTVVDKRPSK